MTYKEYRELIYKRFPDEKFPYSEMDMVNMVTRLLFVDGETETVLAVVTRSLLINLSNNGYLGFV